MKVSTAIQICFSGYYLVEEIVNFFDIKKCSVMFSCAVPKAFGKAVIDF